MRVAILDYGSGNLRSAARAFAAAGHAGAFPDFSVEVTANPDVIRAADRLVLPGQGAFADCMQGLSQSAGMIDALHEAVFKNGKPFFGICVGMQLLAEQGYEHGTHNGLNWLGGVVKPMQAAPLKIPHMGWNAVQVQNSAHPLLQNIGTHPHFYFVHSYAYAPAKAADIFARCDYGGVFAAAVLRDNMFGTQFHPEKSQKTGLQLIRNFLDWRP